MRTAPAPLTCSPTLALGRRRRGTIPRRLAVTAALVVTVLAGALSGCSASGGSSASTGERAANGSQANAGKAQTGAEKPQAGAGAAGGASAAADRQVVQTGEIHLTVPDPVASVTRVVDLVTQAGGRVDAHEEAGASAAGPGSATLTVRIPAAQVEHAVATLRGFGDVTSFTLQATDVTGTAQDLDARIDAAKLSVARMQDLMSRATTTADLISTEQALSERQSALEQLQGQRAVLAEQVALSTLTVVLSAPGTAPAPRVQLHSFADGWRAGLHALGAAARALLVTVGVLGPWLAAAAVVAAVPLGVRRARRRRAAESVTTPSPTAPQAP